jgi:hypothetical protein
MFVNAMSLSFKPLKPIPLFILQLMALQLPFEGAGKRHFHTWIPRMTTIKKLWIGVPGTCFAVEIKARREALQE